MNSIAKFGLIWGDINWDGLALRDAAIIYNYRCCLYAIVLLSLILYIYANAALLIVVISLIRNILYLLTDIFLYP